MSTYYWSGWPTVVNHLCAVRLQKKATDNEITILLCENITFCLTYRRLWLFSDTGELPYLKYCLACLVCVSQGKCVCWPCCATELQLPDASDSLEEDVQESKFRSLGAAAQPHCVQRGWEWEIAASRERIMGEFEDYVFFHNQARKWNYSLKAQCSVCKKKYKCL